MPWNSTFRKPNKPLARVGKVARRRLALVMELREQAEQEGWLTKCEVGPILKRREITFVRCAGPLTFAHSVKSSKRGKDPELDREAARCCETHHYYVLDLLPPALTAEIVREAISLRG